MAAASQRVRISNAGVSSGGQRHDEVAVALLDVTALARPVWPDDVPRKIRDEAIDRGRHVAQ